MRCHSTVTHGPMHTHGDSPQFAAANATAPQITCSIKSHQQHHQGHTKPMQAQPVRTSQQCRAMWPKPGLNSTPQLLLST
mmetsp:Transcript_3040/g.7576  ORF Transcript_3040/g.7576 Transcript_3040/m.7576 type:complete len:80 (-) Transcript_3040:940-1179(-)